MSEPSALLGIAQRANTDLAAQPAAYQGQVRRELRERFLAVRLVAARRRVEEASYKAEAFALGVEATRECGATADVASRALDGLVLAARSALELAGRTDREVAARQGREDLPATAWFEPVQSLANLFGANERALQGGRLLAADFMRGHDIIVTRVMGALCERLGIRGGWDRLLARRHALANLQERASAPPAPAAELPSDERPGAPSAQSAEV